MASVQAPTLGAGFSSGSKCHRSVRGLCPVLLGRGGHSRGALGFFHFSSKPVGIGMAEAAWEIGREGRAGPVLPRTKLPWYCLREAARTTTAGPQLLFFFLPPARGGGLQFNFLLEQKPRPEGSRVSLQFFPHFSCSISSVPNDTSLSWSTGYGFEAWWERSTGAVL